MLRFTTSEPLALSSVDIIDFSDVLFLAWREKFGVCEKTGILKSQRDLILDEIIKIEERFIALEATLKYGDEFDELVQLRFDITNKLWAAEYGGDPEPESYEDTHWSISNIGINMGWERAIDEINAREPSRLPSRKRKNDKHRKRAIYVTSVKKYCEGLWNWMLSSWKVNKASNPPPFYGIEVIDIPTPQELMRVISLIQRCHSDAVIYETFVAVFNDSEHRHFEFFKAVNSEIQLMLLGSLKSLERSLTKGRSDSFDRVREELLEVWHERNE